MGKFDFFRAYALLMFLFYGYKAFVNSETMQEKSMVFFIGSGFLLVAYMIIETYSSLSKELKEKKEDK